MMLAKECNKSSANTSVVAEHDDEIRPLGCAVELFACAKSVGSPVGSAAAACLIDTWPPSAVLVWFGLVSMVEP